MHGTISNIPKILIFGHKQFSQLVSRVLPEFEGQAQFKIVDAIVGSIYETETHIKSFLPDIVISAGSNASYLKQALDIPVFSLPVLESDMLVAVNNAAKVSSNIHIFSYDNNKLLITLLNSNSHLNISYHQYSTAEEAKRAFKLTKFDKDDVVIGASLICDLAMSVQLAAFLIYSETSCRACLAEAITAYHNDIMQLPTIANKPSSALIEVIAQSKPMLRLLDKAKLYASSPAPVLITGESGTGKELLARFIHSYSNKALQPFIAINCAAMPIELFESELFGYVDGSFTGASKGGKRGLLHQAQHGTLFLDEIGEMPLALQTKLLRVLQEQRYRPIGGHKEIPIDIKIISATNQLLSEKILDNSFRTDLYYRLNVLNLHVLALRDRPEDIMPILNVKLTQACQSFSISTVFISSLLSHVNNLVEQYEWSGNIRELDNVAQRLALGLSTISKVTPNTFNELINEFSPELHNKNKHNGQGLLCEHEFKMVNEAMIQFNNNKTKAAKYLGISQTTLWRRLQKLKEIQSRSTTHV